MGASRNGARDDRDSQVRSGCRQVNMTSRMASSVTNSSPALLLSYGLRRRRPWPLLIVVLFTAIALPTSWFVRPRIIELYSEHQQRKEICYQVQLNLDEARSAIAKQQWSYAQISIDKARLAACANPIIFTAGDTRQFRDRIEQVELDQLQAQENAERHQMFELPICSRPSAAGQQRNTIADLCRTADKLVAQMQAVEAPEVIDQILILDPENAHARDLRVFVWAYFGPASSSAKSP
jgi:hypothetical protein